MLMRLARLLAPPLCVGCEREGFVICDDCKRNIEPTIPRCTYCKKYNQKLVCDACKIVSGLDGLFATGRYVGELRNLIWRIKFEHQREAAIVGSELIDCLPCLEKHNSFTVTSVPSAAKRIRQRGFDHAELLAKNLANRLESPYQRLLYRRKGHRQVGASREERFTQAGAQFGSRKRASGAILLVDDVVTSGASLSACAHLLKSSGASRVYAIVLTQD